MRSSSKQQARKRVRVHWQSRSPPLQQRTCLHALVDVVEAIRHVIVLVLLAPSRRSGAIGLGPRLGALPPKVQAVQLPELCGSLG